MAFRTVPVSFLCIAAWGTLQAQITVDPMAPLSLCGVANVNVGFTAGGTYNAGNAFTVELSDGSGSFAAPAAIGSVAGTGSGTIACAFPAGIVGGSGWAIRVVASDPPEVGDAYLLPITTEIPPDAGQNATITVCSSDPSFSMFQRLGGTPQLGGSWTNPLGTPMSGVFTPMVDPPGMYTYTVAGMAPCANATSTLVIMVHAAPNAGTSGTATFCPADAPFSLSAHLGGSPAAGGTWTYVGGPHSGIFVPGADVPGVYTYTVPGVAPCAMATATVAVTQGTCVTGPGPLNMLLAPLPGSQPQEQ